MAIVDEILTQFPNLTDRVNRLITPERMYRWVKALADTPAPSQTVPWTRGRTVRCLLSEDGFEELPRVRYSANYRATGSAALLLGENPSQKRVWLLSHLDICSYLIEPEREGRYPLTSLAYHMATSNRPGLAMRHLPDGEVATIAEGTIVTEPGGGIWFEPADPGCRLTQRDRVVMHHPVTLDPETGLMHGHMDNAVGAVVGLMAAQVLAAYPVEVLVGLHDEEEAPAGAGNQTLSRGGARLLRHFAPPDLAVVSDSHEALPLGPYPPPRNLQRGDGACFAEKASYGKGGVTPPALYVLQKELAAGLAPLGIALKENLGGYVARSECVNAMLYTPNVALVGFLNTDRHFNEAVPTAHLGDVVHLARALVFYALLPYCPSWSWRMAQEGGAAT